MYKIKLFIDTNAFLFFLRKTKHSSKISAILDDESNELFTSAVVLNELKYKLLWLEATDVLHTDKKYEIVNFIKKDKPFRERVLIKYLEFYRNLVGKCTIFPLDRTYELISVGVMLKYGLLTTDAYIVATMKKQKIQHILTNDKDFEKIKGLKIVKIV